MAKKNPDLHGSVPEKSARALILIDVINDFDFPNAPRLLRTAFPAARKIATLKKRIRRAGIPAIYVNDNFGRWRSDFQNQITHCLQEKCKGRDIATLLRPSEEDYFVLKPKHSGFFCTSLDILLEHLGTEEVIIVGFATDICVLHTANDAFMRDFRITAPSDCVAAETTKANAYGLAHMKKHFNAKITPSSKLRI